MGTTVAVAACSAAAAGAGARPGAQRARAARRPTITGLSAGIRFNVLSIGEHGG